jgi:predicted nuclease of restriction endonuclease-like RecB superfamily
LILPPDLIRARRRKGTIRLTYANRDHLSLAKTLIEVYEEHVGRTRGELNEALSGCEELGFNYKLVRGLSAILEDRCVFVGRSSIPPVEARRAVFEEAARRVIATEDDRKRALAAVAFRMGVSTFDLDRSLYADLDDEQELSTLDAVSPLDLIKEYNFALTLALLAHAKLLELNFSERDGEIDELVKKLGESNIQSVGDTSKIIVDWRPTRRMGYKASQLEDILTRLTSKRVWRLSADVVYPFGSRKSHRFEIGGDLEGKMIKPGRKEKQIPVKTSIKKKILSLPRGEIIDAQREAFRLGITEDELKKQLMEENAGYLDLGGILITEAKRDEIGEALAGAADMRFKAVRGLLRKLGCRAPLPLLEALGYDVEWNRDRDESMVYRIGRKTRP